MTLGALIHNFRTAHGLSQRQFALSCGMSNGYIAMLERGKNPNTGEPIKPSLVALKKIANGLNMTVAELFDSVDDMPVDMGTEIYAGSTAPKVENIIPMPKTYTVPLVGTIACGQPILAVEDADEAVNVPEWVHADFALRCKGDSMINARIFDGDIVYIQRMPNVEPGQIAAVRIEDEATLKKVYYTPGSDRITLRACNPLYPDLIYEGETLEQIEVLGLAVGFYSAVRHEM